MARERKSIWQRINIIDVLVLVLVLVVAVLLAVKFVGGEGRNQENTKLTYTVQVERVPEVVYSEITGMAMPDTLMAGGKMLNGKVIAVSGEESPQKSLFVTYDAHGLPQDVLVNDIAKKYYDMTFVIEAYVADPVKSEVGTQEVRVGKYHIVKTKFFELDKGVIIACSRETLQDTPAPAEAEGTAS